MKKEKRVWYTLPIHIRDSEGGRGCTQEKYSRLTLFFLAAKALRIIYLFLAFEAARDLLSSNARFDF